MKLTIKQAILNGDRINTHNYCTDIFEIDNLHYEEDIINEFEGIMFYFDFHDKNYSTRNFYGNDAIIEEIILDGKTIYKTKVKDECSIGYKDGQRIQADEIEIKDLDFSKRTFGLLNKAHFETLDQITEHTEKEIMSIYNLGARSLKEIKDKLKEYGLELKK